MIQLDGITWNHTRGYLPMVAAAQRYSELHADVSIRWQVRSLQEFADFPIQLLAEQFDLLVIDHPFCGYAANHGTLVPLDEWIPKEFLDDQAAQSVGRSNESYCYEGHQWALAIDAATPISGWRPDLMEQFKVAVPRNWAELTELASRGLVAFPAIPIDSLMHFYMLCGGEGQDPFQSPDFVIGEDIGVVAIRKLYELCSLCNVACLRRNPIATWELLASAEDIVYCPFAYGYSNYWRRGYAAHPLTAGELIYHEGGAPYHSTLGGTGLAISSHSNHKQAAAEYAQFVASPGFQLSSYFDSGGQPGYRKAWLDPEHNRLANGFFQDTLTTLDTAYLRPRFEGYLTFQEEAGRIIHQFLLAGGKESHVIAELNRVAAQSYQAERFGTLP